MIGVINRQVNNTESRHSVVFIPMAFIGTIFMARKDIIAATVVTQASVTPQPVPSKDAIIDSLRFPV